MVRSLKEKKRVTTDCKSPEEILHLSNAYREILHIVRTR